MTSPYQIFGFLHALILITLFTFLYFRDQSSLILYGTISIAFFVIGMNTNNQILRNGYWNLFYAVGLILGHFFPLIWHQLEEDRFRLWDKKPFILLALSSPLALAFACCCSLPPPNTRL